MTQLPSADEVAGAFREVLSGPEFATFGDTLGQRIVMWLLNQWTRALQWMRDLVGDGGPGLLTTIVVAAALVAIAAMVLVARRHAHRLKVSGDADDDDLAPAARGMADWLALATGRAGRGRWRSAATALYQGLLLEAGPGRRPLLSRLQDPGRLPVGAVASVEGTDGGPQGFAGGAERRARSFRSRSRPRRQPGGRRRLPPVLRGLLLRPGRSHPVRLRDPRATGPRSGLPAGAGRLSIGEGPPMTNGGGAGVRE